MPDPSNIAQPQSTGAVLMVRPAAFGANAQTAQSNAFQQTPANDDDVASVALEEFDGLVEGLARAGVAVCVAADPPVPPKPDAVFPNNWLSTHADGTVVLYPMLAENRRLERRDAIVDQLLRDSGCTIVRTVDLSYREAEGKFLEGTGSLVLDRLHGIAYACLSPRTDLDVLGEFAAVLAYDLAIFSAADPAGIPVYHTNVVMAVGTHFAVVCAAAIVEPAQRSAVLQRLRTTGHEVIEITPAQLQSFAGNLLELRSSRGAVIAMSTTAWRSLDAGQRRTLEHHGSVLAADIPCIERIGGGSVRCMIAENHLPRRAASRMS